MNDEPAGLFLTWTCYGTWLPGDPRGHASPVVLADGSYSRRTGMPRPPSADDERTLQRAAELQKYDSVRLDVGAGFAAARAMCDAAIERRWRIARGAVMSNHVHAVVVDCPADAPAVRRILKGNANAALDKHHGSHRRWWTAGGRDQYANNEDSLTMLIRYVAEQELVLVAIVDNVPTIVAR